jgi:hypothetical protein
VTIDRVGLERGAVVARDRVPAPASEWRIADLSIDGAGLTTRPGRGDGRLKINATINGSPLAVDATKIALAPVTATVSIALDAFALPQVTPYVPAHVLAVPRTGTARAALKAIVATAKDATLQAEVSGDIGVERLEVVRRDHDTPFFTLGRLGVAIARADLTTREVVVREVALDALTLDAVRARDGAIDLVALVGPAPEAATPAPPAPASTPAAPAAPTVPLKLALERFALTNSSVRVRDEAVTPTAEWKITQLTASADSLTTAADAAPGRYTMSADVNGAKLSIADGTVRLQPVAVGGKLAFTGIDLAWAKPYVPADVPVAPPTGRLGTTLVFDVRPTPVLAGTVSGEVRLDAVGVTHKSGAPLATVRRVDVKLAGADLATRVVRLAAVQLDALDVRAQRAPDGAIDLVTAFVPPASPTPPASPKPATTPKPAATPAAPAAPPFAIQIDSVALRGTSFTLTDRSVTPTAVLPVTDWSLNLRDVTWPNTRPSRVETSLTLPGGGRLSVNGTARVTPLEADIESSLRNATPEPFASYVPFKARLEGRFNGDNRAQVRMTPAGITAKASGRSWAEGFVIRDPDAAAGVTPPLKIERMALDGIDFAWPTSGRVTKVTITRPDARVTRKPDGSLDVVTLFAPRPVSPGAAPPLPAPPSVTPGPPTKPREATPPPGEAAPFALDIDAFVLEEGFARFTDESLTPPFAETLSKLRVTIDGISNAAGRRATLAMTATVGASSTLETRGQIAPLGGLYVDAVTELRHYTLPSVNPYMKQAIAWVMEEGTLSATIKSHVENGVMSVQNNFDVKRIHVAKAPGHDTAQQRLGLPLGMIVALITDRDNGFKTDIPITGQLNDPQFSIGDAVWTAVKNVLVNVAAAPFRAIGRMFTSSDNRIDKLEVEPVPFLAGSATFAPETEQHLIKVGDFLRGAPKIALELAPVITRADAAQLQSAAVKARIERRQKERALPDWAAAVAAEYAQRFPGTPAPGTPAPDVEEQMAKLTAAEPMPDEALSGLRQQRIQAVIDALTKVDGVEAARLRPHAESPIVDDAAPGRIEFKIAQ